MIHTVPILPDAKLAPLADAYAATQAQRRRQLALGIAIFGFVFLLACLEAEVDLPVFIGKFSNFTSYFGRLAHLDSGALVWTSPTEWFWGINRWVRLLGETMLIAYVGTLSGAVLAFCACFVCTPRLMKSGIVRVAMRRVLEFCRTVPDLVFALIFVVAFGLGALPGVLAIAIHTIGALGKLFSEVVDNIDQGPVEGVAAAGGSWFAQVRFGVVPQVMASFASYTLLRFEVNVRGATVIGFVGAGGIGEDLITAIRKFYYSDVSAILLLIILCVMVIDLSTERLRHRLAEVQTAR